MVTAGLSSASFRWIAMRLAVLGLRLRRLARLTQPDAEACGGCSPGRMRNSVTAGLSSASFRRIASDRAVLGLRLRRPARAR